MRARFTLRKIVATVILTVLIWVWADLALDEELTVSNARLTVAKSVNPSLWITISGQTWTPLQKIVLRGSARKVADVRQRINEGRFIPEFYFNPEREKMASPGEYPLDVAKYLNGDDKISQLGLSVVSADPNVVNVSVVELQKKQVAVRCFDDGQNPLKAASIEPAQVEAYVPVEREGTALEAKVVLNRREIEQARLSPIEKIPYVELAPGQTRESPTRVKISLPVEGQRLQEYLITNVRLGFSLSANMQGKYKIELINPEAVMGTVAIRSTPEAKRAYDNMRYHVILEIDDSDKDSKGEELRRDLTYNFPPEFVRKDEIILNQTPVQAKFRLTSLAPATTELPKPP
ncbi:MAG: hypothetical protein JW749_08960 [Sedimentisphaerales bacterium]|nr:hypothetical protein [Sedimentisphaerales bacterium]